MGATIIFLLTFLSGVLFGAGALMIYAEVQFRRHRKRVAHAIQRSVAAMLQAVREQETLRRYEAEFEEGP